MTLQYSTRQYKTTKQHDTTHYITSDYTAKHLHYMLVAAHYITMHLHFTLIIKIYMCVTITHMHGACSKFFHAHSSGSKMLPSQNFCELHVCLC